MPVNINFPQTSQAEILLPCGAGELIDKITILEIKADHLTDAGQLDNVRYELARLRMLKIEHGLVSLEVLRLEDALKATNMQLWHIEDSLRLHEQKQSFDSVFIDLARQVYKTNDRRAALKKEINLLCKSAIVEEKSYAAASKKGA